MSPGPPLSIALEPIPKLKTDVLNEYQIVMRSIRHVYFQPNVIISDASGDSAYSGQRDAIQRRAPNTKSFIQPKTQRHRLLSEGERAHNRTKSRVRAKVEHAFLVIKQIFG